MNFGTLRKTWSQTVDERNAFRLISIMLACIVAMLAALLFTKEKVVVLVPPTINEVTELSTKQGSSGFKKSWALYVAMLVGNVKPGTADLIVTELQSLMRPDVLENFKSALAIQLEKIRRDQISVDFEASQIFYEKESDTVFVLGKSILTGPIGKSAKYSRVIEIRIDVRNFSPVITYLDTYEGDPHTLAWRDREEKRLKALQERGIKPEDQPRK